MTDVQNHDQLAGGIGRAELRAASQRGITINYIAQAFKLAAQFVYSVFLARLLVPADFGVVAMAAPLLAFVALIADLGLSQAAIQRANITHSQLSSLFWITVGLTAILTVCVLATAPLVAAFYGEPRVAPVVVALGILLLVGSLGAQHSALLNRNLAFGKIALIDLSAFAIACIAGIAAALAGLGLWAIVINQAAVSVTTLVLLWLLVPWRPASPRKPDAEVRSVLGFGGNVAIFNLMNFVSRNLDNVLIGKVWGEGPLGLYDRAYKLLLLPLSQVMTPISKVALPLLSRVQHEPDSYRRAYWRMLNLVLLLTYPAALFALMTHEELIISVLGPQWTGAAPIFGILAVGALFAPISGSTNWLLTTQGRTIELRNYSLFGAAGFACAIVLGLPFGPTGVAAAYIGFGTVQGPVLWILTTRRGHIDLRQFLAGMAPYGLAVLPVVAVLYAADLTIHHDLWTLAARLALSYLVFGAAMLVTPRGRADLLDIYSEVKHLLKLGRPAQSRA